MEIEIEKISKHRFTKKSLLLGLKFCLEKNVETRIFRNFWRKFFPKIKEIYIEWSNAYGCEIYNMFVNFSKKSEYIVMNNENNFYLYPQLNIIREMSDFTGSGGLAMLLITIKSDF